MLKVKDWKEHGSKQFEFTSRNTRISVRRIIDDARFYINTSYSVHGGKEHSLLSIKSFNEDCIHVKYEMFYFKNSEWDNYETITYASGEMPINDIDLYENSQAFDHLKKRK